MKAKYKALLYYHRNRQELWDEFELEANWGDNSVLDAMYNYVAEKHGCTLQEFYEVNFELYQREVNRAFSSKQHKK